MVIVCVMPKMVFTPDLSENVSPIVCRAVASKQAATVKLDFKLDTCKLVCPCYTSSLSPSQRQTAFGCEPPAKRQASTVKRRHLYLKLTVARAAQMLMLVSGAQNTMGDESQIFPAEVHQALDSWGLFGVIFTHGDYSFTHAFCI